MEPSAALAYLKLDLKHSPMRDSSTLIPLLYERYGKDAVESQLGALARHGDVVDDPELWLKEALEHRFKFIAIEQVNACPCGSARTRPRGKFLYGNLLGMRECEQCGLIFVSPRLTADAMGSVFTDHYFDYNDLEWWGFRRIEIFADVMRLLESRGVQRVFDVGAAYGHFVKYAKEKGLTAAGSDISPKAVEVGRDRLGVELHAGPLTQLALPAESVDAVVSLDAFYYVADPRRELDAMRRIVRPGGFVVLRLRNGFWSRLRARAGRSQAIGRPVLPAPHLWGFTPKSISRLLEVTGWIVEDCEAAAYSRSVFRPFQSVATGLNRSARRLWKRAPILTRSFNVVARRSD